MKLLFIVLTTLFYLAMARNIYQQLLAIWWGNASKTWPSKRGKVLSSKSYTNGRNDYPTIQFKYTVNGVTYKSSRHRWGSSLSPFQTSKQIVSIYPQGKRVTVYYHPRFHRIASLETKVSLIDATIALFVHGLIPIYVLSWFLLLFYTS